MKLKDCGGPFAGDVHLKQEIAKLIKYHNIKTIVETGTYLGDTAQVLSKMAEHFYTIEVFKGYYKLAREKLDEENMILGNSPEELKKLLAFVPVPVLFFLDAHWKKNWPLRDELTAIGESGKCQDAVIVIHDFFVPNSDLGYDSYGRGDGTGRQILDFNYVKDLVYKINPDFRYYYNKVATGKKRGVIYIHKEI